MSLWCGVAFGQAGAGPAISGSPNRGTVTASPQYQIAYFPNAGTTKTAAGTLNIVTDAAGDLTVTGNVTGAAFLASGAAAGQLSLGANVGPSGANLLQNAFNLVGLPAMTIYEVTVPAGSGSGFWFNTVASPATLTANMTGSAPNETMIAPTINSGGGSPNLYSTAPGIVVTGGTCTTEPTMSAILTAGVITSTTFTAGAGCSSTVTLTVVAQDVMTFVTGTGNTLLKTNGTASALSDTGSILSTTESLDLITNSLVSEVANNASTAPVLNELVILSGAPSTATVALVGSTNNTEGVCIANCATTGNAQIARGGLASCVYDGATTAGDYVAASTTVAGNCHDTGAAAYPTSASQIVGRVLSTHGAGGTYSTLLFPPDTVPTGSFASLAGSAACGQMPALTGDATSSAGTCGTSVAKINGTAFAGANGDLAGFGASNIPVDEGFLASNVVRKDAANTGAAAMTLDMSGATGATALKVPVIAGATAGADGVIDYDSTNKNTHFRTNGADSIGCGFASAPVTGDLVSVTIVSGNTACSDAGILATNIVRKDAANTAAAAMTLDMSGSTVANGFKVPVAAGCTSGADGAICYDSTNKNTHIRINGADGLAVGMAAAVPQNKLLKSGSGTFANGAQSSILDNGTAISSAEVATFGNTVKLTADSSGIVATTAATATTVFTFPALTASTNYSFHCSGTTTQATAGGGIGIAFQTATTAATNMEAHATVSTSLTAVNAGATQLSSGSLTTTTESAIYSSTTGTLTTQLPFYIDGSIEVGATPPTAFVIGFFSASASDAVTVKRDSFCSLMS